MLSKQDNELGVSSQSRRADGQLMRQYWLPVVYDWELQPDGAGSACARWTKT